MRLNLCLLYNFTNLNLTYDIKDSYSGILYYFNTMSFFHSFPWNIVHNRIHCFTLRKKDSSKNYFTIVLIMQFFKKYRPLRFHIWLKYYFKNILGIYIKNIGWVFWSLGNMLSICFRFSQICFLHVLWDCLVIPDSHLGC